MLSSQQKRELALSILDDPSQRQALIENLTSSDLSEVARELDHICQQAARWSAYIDARGGGGCGDHGHEDANKEGIRAEKRVRKALGYTNP